MNWPLFLGLAHRIGWTAADFWGASMYDFTTALGAHIEMHTPPPEPEPSDEDLMAFFRGQPGYRKAKVRR